MQISTETLSEMVSRGEQLKCLLESNPDIIRFMELMNSEKPLAIPVKEDRLIGPSEVMKILKISSSRLEEYVKTGKLTAYHTPPSSGRKFWVSEVMAIPIKEVM